MKIYRIKNGYDLPIKGAPEKTSRQASAPAMAGLHPTEFAGIKPRLDVEINDNVKIGTSLFHDKANPDIKFVSPVSGRVTDIQYGPRRVIEAIRVAASGEDYVQHPSFRPAEIAGIARDTLVKSLLEGGLWPLIKRRPFDRIARPDESPSSIFVNAMATAPLAADPEFLLEGRWEDYRAGIQALSVLGKVHVIVDGRRPDSQLAKVSGAEVHGFIGKHPAGLASTHISRIDPVIRPGKVVWTLSAADAARIGSFLLVGRFPRQRRIAISGVGAKQNSYVDSVAGVALAELLKDNLQDGEQRLISGNVLTGRTRAMDGYLGFYDDLVTVLPEDREQHFIGWMLPGFTKPTYSRAYMSGFLPGQSYAMGTSLHGEVRSLVKTGDYNKVVALDILPDFLVKAILAEDIDQMEQLGILECAPEDFALCSYICPSKTEFTEIIEQGLELMEKEVS